MRSLPYAIIQVFLRVCCSACLDGKQRQKWWRSITRHPMEKVIQQSSQLAAFAQAPKYWEYVAKQLDNFKSGKRKSTAMADMAAKLTPDEMLALGRYFEKQTVVSEPAKDGALAAVGSYIYQRGNPYSGVAPCATCHGPGALGTTQLPRLAGQFAPYIEGQLKQFNQRERTNDNAVMHSIASKMTALEMAAVAEYLASK